MKTEYGGGIITKKRGDDMGKKYKKKYKQIKKEYDALFCENIRLKTDDDTIKNMTDEQILHLRDIKSLASALKKIYH